MRNPLHTWRTFVARLAKKQAAEEEAKKREGASGWGQIGPSLVAAALIWSATYFLVTYPQTLSQLQIDVVAIRKLDLEGQELSALSKVLKGVEPRAIKRAAHVGDIFNVVHVSDPRQYAAFRIEDATNEMEAANDLGTVTPFEDMGFDWARKWAKSWADFLNSELNLWYAEDDVIDAMLARRGRALALERVNRQQLVLKTQTNRILLFNTELRSFADSTEEETRSQVRALSLRAQALIVLYDLALGFIGLVLVVWLLLSLRKLLVRREARKRAKARPDFAWPC